VFYIARRVPLLCHIGGYTFVQHLPVSRHQPFSREIEHDLKALTKQLSIHWLIFLFTEICYFSYASYRIRKKKNITTRI